MERLHSLDFLRALMMFLGILLHGTLSFVEASIPFWPVVDNERSPAADLFVFVVHQFRMQTFFFLAGFFGCLLYQRYGLGGMLRHRLLRIAVPFGLALLIVEPTLQAVWLLGRHDALRFVHLEIGTPTISASEITTHFRSGRFLEYIYPLHLWFLYYLLLFFMAMVPLLAMGNWLSATRLGRRVDNFVRRSLTVPGKTFLLAAVTLPLIWPSKIWGMADTPEGWGVLAHLAGYYFFFFLAGWLLRRCHARLEDFTRGWKWSLIVGNLVVLPLMLRLVFEAVMGLQGRAELPGIGHRLATNFASTLYTWSMIVGLMGAFQHYVHGERAWARYLADASYWCYLWHLTPIVLLQMLLAPMLLPGLVKYAIIIAASMALLLLTYEWGVRYTAIGALLNGRRRRQAANGSIGHTHSTPGSPARMSPMT